MEYELGTIKVYTEIQDDKTEEKISSFHDVTAKYSGLTEKPKEHIYAVFLGNNNEVIGDKLIGLGGNQSAQFDVQDLARTAALVNAGAVILVHNHPSGNSEPTQQDIETTQEIHDTLSKLNIQLLDHVIISRSSNHSMKNHNQGPF